MSPAAQKYLVKNESQKFWSIKESEKSCSVLFHFYLDNVAKMIKQDIVVS